MLRRISLTEGRPTQALALARRSATAPRCVGGYGSWHHGLALRAPFWDNLYLWLLTLTTGFSLRWERSDATVVGPLPSIIKSQAGVFRALTALVVCRTAARRSRTQCASPSRDSFERAFDGTPRFVPRRNAVQAYGPYPFRAGNGR